MKKAAIGAMLVTSAAAVCVDAPGFVDERGADCSSYAGMDCRDAAGLSPLGLQNVLDNCQFTCDSCVKAADFCEVGIGGDQFLPSSEVANFDFYDQEFLSDNCTWIDTPLGMRQTTNAWGASLLSFVVTRRDRASSSSTFSDSS